MSHERKAHIDLLISEQAAEWFVRLTANDLTGAERFAFWLWLKESPRHVAAFFGVRRLYEPLHRMRLRSLEQDVVVLNKPTLH